MQKLSAYMTLAASLALLSLPAFADTLIHTHCNTGGSTNPNCLPSHNGGYSVEMGYIAAHSSSPMNDAILDSVVSSPSANVSGITHAGIVQVFSNLNNEVLWTATGAATAERFGYRVRVMGDCNSDGFPEVAVSSELHAFTPTNDAGKVTILSGRDGSILLDANQQPYSWRGVSGDNYGASLAVINETELLIGAPQERAGIGNFGYVDRRDCTALASQPPTTITFASVSQNLAPYYHLPNFSYEPKYDQQPLFGTAIAVGDFNGDRQEDIAISAENLTFWITSSCFFPTATPGAVFTLLSGQVSPANPRPMYGQMVNPCSLFPLDQHLRFGHSLSVVPPKNPASANQLERMAQLVVGSPTENNRLTGARNAGSVTVASLDPATRSVWQDQGGGVKAYGPQMDAQFGNGVAVANYNAGTGAGKDLVPDIVVGMPTAGGQSRGGVTVLKGFELTNPNRGQIMPLLSVNGQPNEGMGTVVAGALDSDQNGGISLLAGLPTFSGTGQGDGKGETISVESPLMNIGSSLVVGHGCNSNNANLPNIVASQTISGGQLMTVTVRTNDPAFNNGWFGLFLSVAGPWGLNGVPGYPIEPQLGCELYIMPVLGQLNGRVGYSYTRTPSGAWIESPGNPGEFSINLVLAPVLSGLTARLQSFVFDGGGSHFMFSPALDFNVM